MNGRESSILLVVDVQGNLAGLVHESEELIRTLQILIRGMRLLEVPLLWTEHFSLFLGRTVEELARTLAPAEPLHKMSFSCMKEERVAKAVEESGRNRVILAGIETHVCIYQTARDLLEKGYDVTIAEDAVSSRRENDKRVSLERSRELGAHIATTEMILFDLFESSEHPRYEELIRLVS